MVPSYKERSTEQPVQTTSLVLVLHIDPSGLIKHRDLTTKCSLSSLIFPPTDPPSESLCAVVLVCDVCKVLMVVMSSHRHTEVNSCRLSWRKRCNCVMFAI